VEGTGREGGKSRQRRRRDQGRTAPPGGMVGPT